MIKKGIDLSYKVDPYGTEEIISSAANSCAPFLTIDYGDEVQTDAEFTIRPTKGSLDTNISDVASINPIKGNTVAWNQLYDSAVPSALSGHKYFIREKNGSTVAKSISTTISYTADSTERNCIDLTLIYGGGNEPSTVESFEADYYKWFGKQLTYEPYSAGELRPVKMSYLKSIGFNQWDEQWEAGGISTVNGGETPTAGFYRSKNFIPVVAGTDYYYKCPANLFIIFYDVNKVFLSYYEVRNQVKTVPSSACYIRFRNATANTWSPYDNDICINISNNGKDGTYEPYKEHRVKLDVTTLTGKLNGQGNSVVVFPDGMKKAGSVYDEIVKVNGVWKAIKRVGSIDLGTLTWTYDSGNLQLFSEVVDSSSGTWNYNVTIPMYYQNSGNASEVPEAHIRGITGFRIYIVDPAYSDGGAFQSDMNGTILYYELSSPLEYIIDAFDVQKMMLGSNEVQKVYLGSNVVFQNQS